MKRINWMIGLLVLAIIVSFAIQGKPEASSATPGTVNDPLVTKSYVDELVGNLKEEMTAMIGGTSTTSTTSSGEVDMEALYAYIDEKVAELGEGTASQSSTDQANTGLFTVVEAQAGQKIICGASAEIILRAGTASVIAGANGDGLADLTDASDLKGGDSVPLQHHLLVSRDDGRGIYIETTVTYVLVKGDYRVE